MMRTMLKAGFTLVELLVTLILLGLLTAVVFPIVVQQIDDAEPTKVANDLANIRTGVEVFRLNVRPRFPGDLEDLAHQLDATTNVDPDITGANFEDSHVEVWNGPYIDAAIGESGASAQETGDAILTGFDFQIQNELVCFDRAANTDAGTTCTEGTHFVALKIVGATVDTDAVAGSEGTEFEAIDEMMDDSDGVAAGKIRATDPDGTPDNGDEIIYYLVTPYSR